MRRPVPYVAACLLCGALAAGCASETDTAYCAGPACVDAGTTCASGDCAIPEGGLGDAAGPPDAGIADALPDALPDGGAWTGVFEDDFVAPLAGWTDVKTAYGAKGDGVTDDTAAIQKAMTELPGKVLYFPAGTYLVSSTIVADYTAGMVNAEILGEDPAKTTIRWTGPAGAGMFRLGGLSYSKIGRITFDGGGNASFLVYGDSSGGAPNCSPDPVVSARGTQVMFFDDVFENADRGIINALSGQGCQDSEWPVIRSTFKNDKEAGISIEGWNGGDVWVFWSTFQDCGIGIANGMFGAPMTFSVYGSSFFGSTDADIKTAWGPFAVIRDNFSSGSNQFFHEKQNGANPIRAYLQGNRILDTTNPVAIESDSRALTLVDNVVRSKPGATGPAVQVLNSGPTTPGATLFSLGNRFTVTSPEEVDGTGPHLWSYEDATVDYGSIDATIPTLPGTPPKVDRPVTEITAGATAVQIQAAIDGAVANAGKRPIVHLQAGGYDIDRTLTIPPSLDLELMGDGFDTTLTWTGAADGTLLALSSPSKARVQDLYVDGKMAGNAIDIGTEDAALARVQLEEVLSDHGAGPYGLRVEGLTNARVNLYGCSIQSGTTSVHSVVGTGVAGVPSRVACFGCGEGPDDATSFPSDMYHVSNQGNLVVFEAWYEGGDGVALANLANTSGNLTLIGGNAFPRADFSTPFINLDDFQGTFTLVGYDLHAGNLAVANATSATNALVLTTDQNVSSGGTANLWAGPYSGTGNTAMLGCSQRGTSGSVEYADQTQGVSLPLPQDFVDKMFALARSTAGTPNMSLPPGVSDVQLSRVGIYGGTNAALRIKKE